MSADSYNPARKLLDCKRQLNVLMLGYPERAFQDGTKGEAPDAKRLKELSKENARAVSQRRPPDRLMERAEFQPGIVAGELGFCAYTNDANWFIRFKRRSPEDARSKHKGPLKYDVMLNANGVEKREPIADRKTRKPRDGEVRDTWMSATFELEKGNPNSFSKLHMGYYGGKAGHSETLDHRFNEQTDWDDVVVESLPSHAAGADILEPLRKSILELAHPSAPPKFFQEPGNRNKAPGRMGKWPDNQGALPDEPIYSVQRQFYQDLKTIQREGKYFPPGKGTIVEGSKSGPLLLKEYQDRLLACGESGDVEVSKVIKEILLPKLAQIERQATAEYYDQSYQRQPPIPSYVDTPLQPQVKPAE